VIFDPQLPFIHPSKFDRSEIHVPQPVVNLLETDVLPAERLGDANPIRLPSDSTVAADEAYFEMPGVFDSRKLPRELPRRRAVGRRWRFLSEPFVGSFFVELASELVEPRLLCTEVPTWRSRRLGLESLVHAFVPAVLVGMRGLDQLGVDAEPNPPHRKLGQATEGRRREWDAVVGTDDAR